MVQHSQLDLHTIVERSSDSIFADSAGETVMLNLATNSYYGLDPIGSFIWQMLAQPTSMAVICEALYQRFDVAAATCQQDVADLLQEFIDEKLAHVVAV